MEKNVEPKSQTDEVVGQSKPVTKPAKVQQSKYNNNNIGDNNNMSKSSNNNWSNCYTV